MTFAKTRMWSGLAGTLMFALLAAGRVLAYATDRAVFVAGRELQWGCIFRKALGVPCPGCGMTRSVVLALDGEMGRAFAVNPGGPLLVAGALLLCAALILLTLSRHSRQATSLIDLPRKLRLGAAAYGALVAVVLTLNWLRVVA